MKNTYLIYIEEGSRQTEEELERQELQIGECGHRGEDMFCCLYRLQTFGVDTRDYRKRYKKTEKKGKGEDN